MKRCRPRNWTLRCLPERQGFAGVCRSLTESDLFLLQAPCRQISPLRVPLQRKLGHVSSPQNSQRNRTQRMILNMLPALDFIFASEVSRTLILLYPWTQDSAQKFNTESAWEVRNELVNMANLQWVWDPSWSQAWTTASTDSLTIVPRFHHISKVNVHIFFMCFHCGGSLSCVQL